VTGRVRIRSDPDADRVLRQFGKDLQAARKAAGLSQAEIGKQVGVSDRTVSYAELGKRNLRWSVMYALARVLGYRLGLVFIPADRKPENGGN
jgi:transcriptional regulator with XRE-family HTH domain